MSRLPHRPLPQALVPRIHPSLRELGSYIARHGILLAHDLASAPIRIPISELRSHCAIFGKSGRGKSRLLYGIVGQLIMAGETVVLLDGKGDLVDEVLSFAVRLGRRPEHVAVLDTHDQEWVMGVNPLEPIGSQRPESLGLSLHEALKKVYGEDDVPHPWLDLLQPSMFAALSAAGWSLAEATHFASLTPDGVRFRTAVLDAARPRLLVSYPRQLWLDELGLLPEKDAATMTQVVRTRAGHLYQAPTILPILGQRRSTLDFSRGLNSRGGIFLANLGIHANMSASESRMLGLALLQQVSKVAWERQGVPPERRSRVFVVIDEAHRYISRDFSDGLELLRGLGIHCIFSVQSLAQLEEESEAMARNILGNVNAILSFSVARKDAEAVAHELFTGHLDLKQIKHEQLQTKFRPVETTRTIESKSTGSSDSTGGGESFGSGDISVSGLSYSTPGEIAFGATTPMVTSTNSSSHGTSSSSSSSHSWSNSTSSSTTVTEVPFIEAHEFQEVSSTQFFSLQEAFEMAVSSVKCQGVQHVVVGWGDHAPRAGMTPSVFPRRLAAPQLDAFRHASSRLFCRPRAEVFDEIRLRVSTYLGHPLEAPVSGFPGFDEDDLVGPFSTKKEKRS